MKISLLVASVIALFVAQFALATPASIVVSAGSPSQNNVAVNGTFNVTFSLSVTPDTTTGTPANFDSFDLYIATAAANSGFFSITNSTSAIFTGAGPAPGNDPIGTAASNASFVRNNVDQGWVAANNSQDVTTPFSNLAFVTLTFKVNPGTPTGTYTLMTTSPTQDSVFFSDMSDNAGTASQNYPFQNSASFQIAVVPEPATWSLLGLGCLGTFALNSLRRRI